MYRIHCMSQSTIASVNHAGTKDEITAKPQLISFKAVNKRNHLSEGSISVISEMVLISSHLVYKCGTFKIKI